MGFFSVTGATSTSIHTACPGTASASLDMLDMDRFDNALRGFLLCDSRFNVDILSSSRLLFFLFAGTAVLAFPMMGISLQDGRITGIGRGRCRFGLIFFALSFPQPVIEQLTEGIPTGVWLFVGFGFFIFRNTALIGYVNTGFLLVITLLAVV